jgi:hypothetical protein
MAIHPGMVGRSISRDRWNTTVAMRRRKGGGFGISHPEGTGSAQ